MMTALQDIIARTGAAAPAVIQWQSPQMLGIALLVAVGAAVLVTLSYARSVQLLPTKWRILLPTLRWLAIAAMGVSLARPVALRPRGEDEQGACVVIVDCSRSMSVRDAQRTPAMLVALADGLGKLPPGTRARPEAFAAIAPDIDRLPSLADAITQSQVELEVAQLQGKENPAAQRRFDEAATEFARVAHALAQARGKLKKAPRLAEALGALERLPAVKSRQWPVVAGRTIAELSERASQFQTESDDALYRNSPQVKQICDDLARLSRFELVEEALLAGGGSDHSRTGAATAGLVAQIPARTPLLAYAVGSSVVPLGLRDTAGQPARRLIVTPDQTHSDLTGTLQSVLNQLRYQSVQAVVLFSDGRQVGSQTAIASSILGGSSIPVFTISPAPPAASAAAVRDLAVERIALPASVFIGEVMTVTADLHWTVARYRPASATLQVGTRMLTRPVEPNPKDPASGTVRFSVLMDEPGPQQIVVSVPPVEGEITDQNNSISRFVKVLSDKFDVLLVGGAASWDFRYLRNTLSRTSWITARSILVDKEGAQLALPPEQVASRDVIILCDTPEKALSGPQWEAVRKMVAQRGGSVILLAGRNYLPRQYNTDALAEFLPWKRQPRQSRSPAWRQWPGDEAAFRIIPSPASLLAQQLSLSDLPQESASRWLFLPPVYRHLSMPPLREIAEPVLIERETAAPILTRHRLGRGNVFFLGIDETWRWRWRVGERDQDRFFQQLVRLAADEPYAATNAALSLDADRVVVPPGEVVRVRARLNEPPEFHPYPAALSLEIVRDGGSSVRTQSLVRVGEEDSGRYEGSVGGLEQGAYQLRVSTADGAQIDYPLHVASNFEAEMAQLTPDEDLLRRLAVSSGGEFRTLDQLRDLPRRLEQLQRQRVGTVELTLWSSWYLYGFVVGCLGLEWALRKRLGLS